jgi:hypothetical protein
MTVLLIYIVAAALVASLGIHRKWGFWGFFVISLILTPLIGLFIIMATDPFEKRDSK